VIGASGFTGEVLTSLLFNHSQVETIALSSRQLEGRNVTDVFKHLSIKSDLKFTSPEDDTFNRCHAVFLCTPHGKSMNMSQNFLKKKIKVIDLSADFRLKQAEVWNKWYGTQHSNPELLSKSVYGLPELHKEDIREANLVAVPGCYPTVSLISILPSLHLKQKIKSITIDAKSGMSGAGRSAVDNHLEKEMLNNFRLYGEKGHRHYPEIKQVVDSLSEENINLTFTVQLLPIMKGIYSTTYINFEEDLRSDVVQIYQEYYKPLINITVVDKPPDLLDVVGTNGCKLFLQTTTTDNQILVTACIDNLLKGAAGQALECFNLMFNFEQNTGLN
jgi:N-acetyl-gamma-glutamyl-phosphate reductase